ncbi:MAG: hypothetical protein JXA23_02490, partial [Bacteroidales bacterium]|nr:hypothetical protein [Bacteroidales bacterium]
MRNLYLIFATGLFLLCQNVLHAQVGINTTGAAPHTSAMLDVTSANKGLLIPRMNQAQRLLIITPAEGLMVYQTDGINGFYYYNGSTWERLTNYSQNLWIDNGSYLYPSGIIGTNIQLANEISYTYGFYSNMNTVTSMGYAGYFKHTNSQNSGTGIYVKASHTGSQNAGYTRGAHIVSESTTQDQTGILSDHTHSGLIGSLTGIYNNVSYDVANPNELFGIHTTSQRNGYTNANYGILSEAYSGTVVYGVYGKGLFGLTSYGVYGIAGDGVINYGVYGKASDWGGYFTHATSNRYVLLGGSLYAIQIVDGRQSAGRVLYTDASGNGYWGELPAIPAAAGPEGAVQFNVGGGFNGQSEFYWNNSIKKLGIHV